MKIPWEQTIIGVHEGTSKNIHEAEVVKAKKKI